MDTDNDSMLIKVQRHYRRQLDFKNCIIQDHLRRQRIYLTRLRDFISRVPSPLREGRYEYLIKSLEELEVHFFESQEDFCNLQCVIHNLDNVKNEDSVDSPSSSASYDPASVNTRSSQNASVAASCDSFSTLPSTSSSSSSSDNSPHQPQQAKRKRRRVTHAPRPASSSSDTNSAPSPVDSRPRPSKGKKRSSPDNDPLEASFMASKRSDVCPLTDDNILPDFSLFG